MLDGGGGHLQRVLDQRVDFHRRFLQFDLALVDTGDIGEIVHQPHQVADLARHHVAALADFLHRDTGLSAQDRQRHVQGRKRAAQLVRQDRKEFVLAQVGLLQHQLLAPHVFQRLQHLVVLLLQFLHRAARLACEQFVDAGGDLLHRQHLGPARQAHLEGHHRPAVFGRADLQVVDQPACAHDAGEARLQFVRLQPTRHQLRLRNARTLISDLRNQRLSVAVHRLGVEQEGEAAFAGVLLRVAGDLRDCRDHPGASQRFQAEQFADLAGALAYHCQAVAADLDRDESMPHQFLLATTIVASSVSFAWSRNSTDATSAGSLLSKPGYLARPQRPDTPSL